MKKTVYVVLVLMTGLTACSKKEDVPAPPAIATMTRSFEYLLRGIMKDTVYTTKSKIYASAGVTD